MTYYFDKEVTETLFQTIGNFIQEQITQSLQNLKKVDVISVKDDFLSYEDDEITPVDTPRDVKKEE